MEVEKWINQGKAEKEIYQKWMKKAAKVNKRTLDDAFHEQHEQVF